MWMKWFPWRYVVRRFARAQGFLDPVLLLANLQRFSRPSEVMAPTELLRAGAIFQARGLMNSQAIQHNMDWVWPYWVERQFNPKDDAFVPRAFNVTHINLTHRNWTAVGLPDYIEMPIVDPRGLVTPLFDGWSLDFWIIHKKGRAPLLPSRLLDARQNMMLKGNLAIETEAIQAGDELRTRVEVINDGGVFKCRVGIHAKSDEKAWLAVSLRPYNPEGVSFVHSIDLTPGKPGWRVNKKNDIFFGDTPSRYVFSHYNGGDVFRRLLAAGEQSSMLCDVGMATAAALYELQPNQERFLTVDTVLEQPKKTDITIDEKRWDSELAVCAKAELPDAHFQFLYDAAVRTLILHSPGDVYPGPYTYKRFWFRDAAFILHAMVTVGLAGRVEHVLNRFPQRQTPFGYYLSQEGEWDSNGEALWILDKYCRMTGRPPREEWRGSILRAGRWIQRKRLSEKLTEPHAGLLPPGFSAEHFGPNDYYYWDDFWGVSGLRAASRLAKAYGEDRECGEFARHADDLMACVEKSLENAFKRLDEIAIPASPYRRMDAGAIGAICGSYPLLLQASDDRRVLNTVEFLIRQYWVKGGFFQEISHSGINAYLTLHVAQVLLRAGDKRFFEYMTAIADIASPTGQWPEAVHPRTLGGCMGDGQHVWAAAEWVLMQRNCFMREEGDTLILCSGIPDAWFQKGKPMSLGPVITDFGVVTVTIRMQDGRATVSWDAKWHDKAPQIEVIVCGRRFPASPGQTSVEAPVALQ